MENGRYFLHLSYKGTNYFGWQIQPNHPSIQEEIETALGKIHGDIEVKITGCGRTDTGVHATNYFAHFDSDQVESTEDLTFALNNMLSASISIKAVLPVEAEAHARFDATARTYHYFIHQEKDPFLENSSWLYRPELDVDLMNQACLILKNHVDFECFSKVKTDVNNFDCTIENAIWIKSDRGLIFSITANRFLRNMVRAIVGTMIEIGEKKMSLSQFQEVLDSNNRSEAGRSVPAHGLYLAAIKYPYIDSTPA